MPQEILVDIPPSPPPKMRPLEGDVSFLEEMQEHEYPSHLHRYKFMS